MIVAGKSYQCYLVCITLLVLFCSPFNDAFHILSVRQLRFGGSVSSITSNGCSRSSPLLSALNNTLLDSSYSPLLGTGEGVLQEEVLHGEVLHGGELTEDALQDAVIETSSSTGATLNSSSLAMKKSLPFPIVLWRFSRPHTLIGSALAIPALHILAAPSMSMILSKQMVYSILYATVPSLLMNIFITGLNQITDVEIDKINKPSLVIASGDLSSTAATAIVLACLAISLLMASSHISPLATPGLNFSLWGSALLGTMYSLPPFRLKRFPWIAALCIVAVRGTIINAGFYAHALATTFGNTQATAIRCMTTDARCMLSSLYFGIFGIVIALMKDVPDIKGDTISNISTFTVQIGPKRIFHAMRRLLFGLLTSTSMAFAWGSVAAVAASKNYWLALSRMSISIWALWAGVSSRQKGLHVNADDGQEVYSYYMSLWNLFYQSYLVLPFAR